METNRFKFSVAPRNLSSAEIAGITDPGERKLAEAALENGCSVSDGGMITLLRGKRGKGDKTSTNPDLLIDEVFVEVTSGENLGSRKAAQSGVMEEAGLADRYVQVTGSDIASLTDPNGLTEKIKRLLGK